MKDDSVCGSDSRVLQPLAEVSGGFGSRKDRIRHMGPPQYAYGVYSAARLACQLGLKRVGVIEFGVAGGRGLIALEDCSEKIGESLGVEVAVLGVDSGKGMPTPLNYRDLPHVWSDGFYRMDVDALRKRLKSAHLILGDVSETVPQLQLDDPVGFVSFDLDYYSSTKRALTLFDRPHATRLPRVFCYFDDLIWPERACHCEFTGELLAIREFNEEHAQMKLAKLNGLAWMRQIPSYWNGQIYVLHDFEHPLYSVNVTSQSGNCHSKVG